MKTTTEITISNEQELAVAAGKFLELLGERKKVALYGQIGAGKTTFVKEICRQLGVMEQVCSPTYAIINQYGLTDPNTGAEKLVHHIDLYRLKSIEEALDIGIEEVLYDENYCFIEWPNLIEAILPEEFTQIKIEILENSGRKIIFL